MSQLKVIFLISNGFSSKLYESALRVCLDAEVTFCESIKEFHEGLKSDKFDVALTHDAFQDSNIVQLIEKIYKKEEYRFITLVLGKKRECFGDFTFFEGKSDIRELVKFIAQKFQITAKDMASLNVGDYYPFPVSLIVPGLESPCNVFSNSDSSNAKLLVRKGATFHQEVLDLLITTEQKDIFVSAIDRVSFVATMIDQLAGQIVGEKDSIHKSRLIDQSQKFILSTLRDGEVDQKVLELSSVCVEETLAALEDCDVFDKFKEKLIEDIETYRYRMTSLIIYFSSYILKKVEYGSKEHMPKLGFVAFFHDMFLDKDESMKIQHDYELNNLDCSDREKETIKKHALLVSRYFARVKGIPFGVDTILLQHHGSTSGEGYKVNGSKISHLSIIFVIAETWSKNFLSEVKDGRKDAMSASFNTVYKRFNVYSPFRRILEPLSDYVDQTAKNAKSAS